MSEAEYGKCECCGKDAVLRRKYYYYHGLPCECHSPEHFELVRHCSDCTPKPPETTTITIKMEPSHEIPDEPAAVKEEACEVREFLDCENGCGLNSFRETGDGPLLCMGCRQPFKRIEP